MKDGEKLRIHNFIVEKIEMDGVDFMEVRTAVGEFRVMYRADNRMFMFLDNLDETDKEMLEAIHLFFTNTLAVSHIIDADLQHAVMMATDAYIEKQHAEHVSEEENQDAIKEEKIGYELKKKMDGSGESDN